MTVCVALLVYFVLGMFGVFIVWCIFVFDCYFGIRLILGLWICFGRAFV